MTVIVLLVMFYFLDRKEQIKLQSSERQAESAQEKRALDQLSAGYERKDRQAVTEKSRDAGSMEEAASKRREADVFYQAGNFEAALDRYQQSLGLLLKDKALARQLTDSLAKAGYRVFAANELAQLAGLKRIDQERQDLNARLRDIRARYKSLVAQTPKASATEPSSSESLAAPLQTKILLRQVLVTEPVLSQYPDLAARVERYLDAISAKAMHDGRKEAIDELDSLLGILQSGDTAAAAPYLARMAGSREQDPVQRLLDRLQEMLR